MPQRASLYAPSTVTRPKGLVLFNLYFTLEQNPNFTEDCLGGDCAPLVSSQTVLSKIRILLLGKIQNGLCPLYSLTVPYGLELNITLFNRPGVFYCTHCYYDEPFLLSTSILPTTLIQSSTEDCKYVLHTMLVPAHYIRVLNTIPLYCTL